MNHFYEIALTLIKGIGKIRIRNLISIYGSAEQVFSRKSINTRISGLGDIIISENDRDEALRRAEAETKFIEKNNITTYFVLDEEYPYRLRECEDAPTILYRKGEANLDAERLVAVVGTRNMTAYGRELTDNFICQIPKTIGNIAIVSGLAYGVDGEAHKAALRENIPTIAVVGHGLDMVYPKRHKQLAENILECGGAIVSEYPTNTVVDPSNFVQRNRIIAGLSDATVIIESACKGGTLLTAQAANSYNRDVFAFAGRVDDKFSQGCNNLIKTNQAQMITDTADMLDILEWDRSLRKPQQASMFVSLSDEEQRIVDKIRDIPASANDLSRALGIPIQKLSATLVMLEFKGVIKMLPGNIYKA